MNNRYHDQRAKVTPPHVPLRALRQAADLTLAQVCARYETATGRPLTVGALSGIENGHRGASAEVLRGLEEAFMIDPGSLTTSYLPRAGRAA